MKKTTFKKDDLSLETLSEYKVQVRDINEKFLQLVWNTIEEQGKKITGLLIERIIDTAQKYERETLFNGDDNVPKSLWDDYCYQKQSEKFQDFKKQEDLIAAICYKELIDMKSENRDQHNILTLYLSQSGFNYDECILCDSELADFFLSEVKSVAKNYTKKHLTEFADR